jgi:hypothetical protein
VVVFDVEDLHAGAVGQPPAGGVGLPAFVRLVGGEVAEALPPAPWISWRTVTLKPRRRTLRVWIADWSAC